jgi:hypothetical protein
MANTHQHEKGKMMKKMNQPDTQYDLTDEEWNAILEACSKKTQEEADEEERARKARASHEWIVDSYSGPRLHFFVTKRGERIYYNEDGDEIAVSQDFSESSRQSRGAQRKAQAFADRLNNDPELAQALLEYSRERDLGKNDNAMTVAQRMQLAAKSKK